MSEHEQLIDSLSSNLASVKPVTPVNLLATGWLIASAAYVIAIIHFMGPIRPNAISQLVTEPRFLIEMLLGMTAIVLTTLAGFRAAIPGALTPRFRLVSIAVVSVWIASYIVGLVNPTLEPSMLGKRHYCVFETFIYALPPIAAAFFITRRLYPLRPAFTALTFSLAAGLIPALYMQIACMYMPDHILKFHIMPGLLVAALGSALGFAYHRSAPRTNDS